MINKSLGLTVSLSLSALACGDDTSDRRTLADATVAVPGAHADAGSHEGHAGHDDAQITTSFDASSAPVDANAPPRDGASGDAGNVLPVDAASVARDDAGPLGGAGPDATAASTLTRLDDPNVTVHTCAGDSCPKGQCTLLAEPMHRCEPLYAGSLPTLDYCPPGNQGARYCLVTCVKAPDSIFCEPFPVRTQDYVVDCTGEAVSISACAVGETCQVEAEATCQPAVTTTP